MEDSLTAHKVNFIYERYFVAMEFHTGWTESPSYRKPHKTPRNMKHREIGRYKTQFSRYKQLPSHCCKNDHMKKHLVDFCLNTSIPGLKYLTEEHRPWYERLLWLIGITISMVACVLLVQQTWRRWTSSPVIVAMDERMSPVWEIPFPAVTVCPLTRIHLHWFNTTAAIDQLHNGSLSDERLDILYDLLLQCDAPLARQTRNLTTNRPIERIEQGAVPLNKTILSAIFRGRRLRVENIFQPVMTSSGLCYTFNMLPNNWTFTPETFKGASVKYLDYKNISVQWTLDGGYFDSGGVNAYPYRTLGTGRESGLTLTLRIDPSNKERFCTDSLQGFQIVLHNPTQMPRIQQQAFVLPTHVATHLAIEAHDVITAEELRKRYTPQQRQCYFQEERQLRFFKQYNHLNCELECITNVTQALCECVSFYMPRVEGTRICDGSQRNCIRRARRLFQLIESDIKNKRFDDEIEKLADTLGDSCNCLQSCIDISYSVEHSHAMGDFNRFFQVSPNGSRSTKETYRDGDIAELVIYYKESHFIPIRRMELYGIVTFIANCGGVLGLCLGMSILSIIEIIYWMFVRPCWQKRKISAIPTAPQIQQRKWRHVFPHHDVYFH